MKTLIIIVLIFIFFGGCGGCEECGGSNSSSSSSSCSCTDKRAKEVKAYNKFYNKYGFNITLYNGLNEDFEDEVEVLFKDYGDTDYITPDPLFEELAEKRSQIEALFFPRYIPKGYAYGGAYNGDTQYMTSNFEFCKNKRGRYLLEEVYKDDEHGIRLYHRWIPLNYTLDLVLSDEVVLDNMFSTIHVKNINIGDKLSDKSINLTNGLPELVPANKDMTFIGWKNVNGEIFKAGENPTFTQEFVSGQNIEAEFTTNTQGPTVTLEAVFENAKGYIKFMYDRTGSNGYVVALDSGTDIQNPSEYLPPNLNVATWEDIMGWSTSLDSYVPFTGKIVKEETIVLYPVVKEFKLIYLDFNDGSDPVKVKVYKDNTFNIEIDITKNKDNRVIYQWYKNKNFTAGETVAEKQGGVIVSISYDKVLANETYYARYVG